MTKRRALSSVIETGPQFARSVNIERDAASGHFDGYIPTARALETLRRVAAAMCDPNLTRAWSVTGPYGSGKSSLALLLDAVCGPAADNRRGEALMILRGVDAGTAEDVDTGLSAAAPPGGFIRAAATAQREPAVQTIVRAAIAGLDRYNAGSARRRNGLLRTARGLLDGRATARDTADFLEEVCDLAPVLLILDEFGKNLEFFAETGGTADLFVLQEVAERASGPEGLPLFLLTLQHLAFEDYATAASVVQRREWAKVQGRFEDIPYTDAPTELLELIARVFHSTDARFKQLVRRWAAQAHREIEQLGIADVLPSTEIVASCYPLHPLTLAVLPELCSRYGQRERTLFSFLARPEPHSVASFLAETPIAHEDLPTVGLDGAYDYFAGSAGTILGTADGASRWLEIDTRIRETQGLTDDEIRCLKIIGVLNLVSRGGALRASAAVLQAALPDRPIAAIIEALEARGIVVYRAFADEFRIWQGSDFDLQGAIDDARRRLSSNSVADLCGRALPLGHLVAARHSQERGVLRFFARTYVDASTPVVAPTANDDEDGELCYVVDETPPTDLNFARDDAEKPVLLVYPGDASALHLAAADAAAVAEVLRTADTLEHDWVARRELHERAALATDRFRSALVRAFDLREGVAMVCRPNGTKVDTGRSRTWSAVLSGVCDEVFHATPVLRNEMLARRTLSSQAARARRDLLTAMVQQQGHPKLGIDGYGPERAMLEAVLLHTGLYRKLGQSWSFHAPPPGSDVRAVWQAIKTQFDFARRERVGLDAVWTMLQSPPFGLPDGAIPVFVVAALLAYSNDLALYQDGTFQPLVGIELLERLVKAPERFTVKHFATSGSRSKVLNALAAELGASGRVDGRRNAALLAVLAPILSTIRTLPEYARHTSALSEPARAVRNALTAATEPDDLVFHALPEALMLAPFRPSSTVTDSRARGFATALSSVLRELADAYLVLLDNVRASLADGLGVPPPAQLPEVRANIGTTARRIVDRVIEPRLRSFLVAAADDQLEDLEWVEYVAMNVAERPPGTWRDDDRRRFDAALAELLGNVRRVTTLHFERLETPDMVAVARQILVTTPEGHTTGAVVWLDEAAAATLDDVVETATTEAARRLGRRGVEALLAMLADRLLLEDGGVVQLAGPPVSYGADDRDNQQTGARGG